jgi:GT2 family glycosyltransferase
MIGEKHSSVPKIGVIVVAFNSDQIIDECLETLFAAGQEGLRVVVVDNHSRDSTCQVVTDWASGQSPFQRRDNCPLPAAGVVPKPVAMRDAAVGDAMPTRAALTLLRSPVNGGYAYAVNLGLQLLLADDEIDLFWVLNPDCVVPSATPAAIAVAGRDANFSLLGGRAIYYERPDEIQTDGGRVSRKTGGCQSVNCGLAPDMTPMPDVASIDYITGASLVASRTFVEAAGLMDDRYFLYYEEVDWAFRRGNLPLRLVPDMIVYHRGGTTIGTGDTTRRASPFANYFNYRNRIWFVRQFLPNARLFTMGFALAKAVQLALKGGFDEAWAILSGTFAWQPPAPVRDRIIGAAAQAYAFGIKSKQHKARD